jgi:tetratricopeptide (TPR) repeat protein
LLGDLDGAVDAFSNAIRILEGVGRSATDAYLRRGICFYYQDKMDVALQDFEAASTVPNNPYIYEPRAMMWAGIAHARRGDFDEAIRNYTRSVAAAPRYTAAYLNRGLAYMNMGRYDMALEDFDTILRQHPNHSAAQRYRDIASRQR